MSVLIFKYKDKEFRLGDKIESIIKFTDMYKKYYKNIPDYQTTMNLFFDNDSQKEDIIKALRKAIRFEINEDSIIVTYKLNNKEIKEIKQNYLKDYNKFLKVLYSYYKCVEYNEIIKAYLIKFNLKYLIKELNRIDKST